MNFVFDLDGTICFEEERMSEQIVEALNAVEKDGHRVIFASARPIRDILSVIHPLFHDHILIGGNGALVVSEQIVIQSNPFNHHDLSKIMKLLKKQKATYLLDGNWNYTYNGPQNHPFLKNIDSFNTAQNVPLETHERVFKILVLHAKSLKGLEHSLQELDVTIHHHTSEGILDISPSSINKRSALQTLGIEHEGYIAFGNDANDIELFKGAQYAVMIGAHKSLRLYADDVVKYTPDLEILLIGQISKLSRHYASELTAKVEVLN